MKKNKEKNNNKKQSQRTAPEWIILAGYFGLGVFLMEMVLKINMDEMVWDTTLAYTFLFSLISGFLIYFPISFFGARTRRILSRIVLGILSVVFSSQLIYYEVFRTFYSLYSAMEGGGQIIQFYREILSTIAMNLHWLLIIFIPFILHFFIYKRIRDPGRFRVWQSTVILVSGILAFGLGMIPLNLGDRQPNSAFDMYYKNSYPIYSVMRLGVITTMRLDLQRSYFGFEQAPEIPGTIDPTDVPTPSPEPTLEPEATPSPTLSPFQQFNIMDIPFGDLIDNAKNEDLAKIHEYFSNVTPARKNDFTGIFEGYNLILITAESYSHYAVDKDLTPTFYKMTHEGVNFTDFYNPVWNVSTSDGEYVATTGLIPKAGVWSMKFSGTKYMPFAMGNQLRKLGYDTYAYHNHTYTYYGRDVSHPNLGYIYKGVGNGLNVKKTWPESDLEMMEVTMPDYIDSDSFHAYYMTVSGHLAYNFFGNQMAVKNKHFVEDLDHTEPARAYLATQIELDRALEYLLEKLEEAGVAEKTLIVVSGDHYPYGLKKADIDDLAGHTVENNFELYKSSLLLYVKGMDPMIVDEPCSSLDIIPTISNLLGLEYDSRLMMGTDIFSDSDPLVIFNNRSFITDKGRYNSLTKTFTPNDGVEVEEGYVDHMMNEIEKKFYYSVKILDLDYYAEVFKD